MQELLESFQEAANELLGLESLSKLKRAKISKRGRSVRGRVAFGAKALVMLVDCRFLFYKIKQNETI